MTLTYNPAQLSQLSGGQVMLNVQNAFYDACVTREGTYGDHVASDGSTDRFGDFADYRNVPYPRVCQDNLLNPGLWLAGTWRVSDRIGLGVGLMTPASAAHLVWGDGKGGNKSGEVPSPVRYQLVEQDIKLFLPTLGLGAKLASWLSLGLSFQAGVALIKNVNYTVSNGTENPSEDSQSKLELHDYFVPAAIFSAHLVPHDNVDLTLYGRVSDDIRAKGEVTIRAGDFGTTPLAIDGNDDVSLRSPQPAQFGISARYADRFNGRKNGERGDPLLEERWDVELSATYHMTSQFDAIAVDIPSLPKIKPDGLQFELPHQWNDQISVRLGSDFNVIRSVLAIRAGLHYETSAISGSYMGIDFQPAQRLGVHAGLTYRAGPVDLSLAYAHIFQETVTVPGNAAAYPQVAVVDAVIVNAGKYQSSYNVASLGATYRFATSL
jgi:hypothetical protein